MKEKSIKIMTFYELNKIFKFKLHKLYYANGGLIYIIENDEITDRIILEDPENPTKIVSLYRLVNPNYKHIKRKKIVDKTLKNLLKELKIK